MSRSRRTLSALVGATAMLLAMAAMPTAAMADSGITVISAGPDASNNPYDLTVVASDTNGVDIASMTAHVFNSANVEVTAPAGVPMTLADGSNQTNEIWAATSPINPSIMAPGVYTVTVDASDSTGENDFGLAAPGSFPVPYVTSSLTVAASPPSVTAGSETVNFTGSLTGTAQGSSIPVGISGAAVQVSMNGGPKTFVAPTQADGSFTYQLTGVSQDTHYDFTVAGTSLYPAADSGDVHVTVQQAATAINVVPTATAVDLASPTVTFNGFVTVAPGGGSPVPLANAPVNLSIGGGPSNQVATTDSKGQFSVPESGITSPTAYNFSVTGTNLYSSAATGNIQVGVNQAVSVIQVKAVPSSADLANPTVMFNGNITAVAPSSPTPQPVVGAPVDLSIGGGPSNQIAVTDSNGHFSVPESDITTTTHFQFSITSTSLYSAASDDVPVGVSQGQTSLQVTASPSLVTLNPETVNFNGLATALVPSSPTPQPVVDAPVFLTIGNAAPTAVTVTGSDGTFRYQINGVTQADANAYTFSIGGTAFYGPATKVVPLGLKELQTTLSVAPTPSTVTEGSQNVTFNGRVTGTSQVDGSTDGIANVPVFLNGSTAPIATTDASGAFSYQVAGVSKQSEYDFSVSELPFAYSAATDAVQISPVAAETQITGIKVLPSRVLYGKNATISGTVQYLDRSTSKWVGLPNAPVALAEGKANVGAVTTDANGVFSASLPTIHGAEWSATVGTSNLTQQATAAGNLDIFVPLKVLSFAATLKVNGDLSAKGCLQVTAPVRYAPQTSVQIQYRPARHGPWRVLGRIQLHNSPKRYASCPGANESYFNDSLRARLANAYYRAYFPANANYTSAASKSIHAWRYETRIVRFSVRPRSITSTTKATVTGRLQVHRNRWRPYAHQPVRLIYNVKGTNYWNSLGRPVITNSRGRFSYYPVEAKAGSGSFVAVIYAQYRGDKIHLACESTGVDVSVNGGQSNSALAHIAPDRFPTVALLPIVDLPVLTPGPPPLTGLLLKQEAA